MNDFDQTVNESINEDWKSKVAAGLVGATLASTPQAQAEPPKQAAQEQPASQQVDMQALIDVLEEIESNKQANAIGDNGNAKGILQIWDVVVKDVNRVYKTKYVHDDAFNPTKARDIAEKYLSFWGKRYQINNKKAPTYEVLARIWNGGPKGYKKSATDKYWKKVKNVLFKS